MTYKLKRKKKRKNHEKLKTKFKGIKPQIGLYIFSWRNRPFLQEFNKAFGS